MKREIIKTADGSSTIFLPDWNEHYHSKHGAKQEALHVFIKSGFQHFLNQYSPKRLRILEIGFGTGLNALLSSFEAEKAGIVVEYEGIEAYPVPDQEVKNLNYPELFSEITATETFEKIHQAPWEKQVAISSHFKLQKRNLFFNELRNEDEFDVIFFDAFGPRVQPELWTEEIFQKMFKALKQPGVLVTYSAKGSVRRAMQYVGFKVERLPGPPGKREMLRANKN